MRVFLAAATWVVLTASSSAQIQPIDPISNAKICAALDADSARVRCYDGIFRSLDLPTTPVVGSPWTISVQNSRLTDKTEVFLATSSVQTVPSRFGEEKYASLGIRCMDDTTSVTIHFGGAFMADNGSYGKVTYRLDDLPAVSKNFEESTDNKTLGLWSGGSSIPLIKAMLGHQKLLVQATPFNDNTVTLDFSIAKLEDEIGPLRKACGW